MQYITLKCSSWPAPGHRKQIDSSVEVTNSFRIDVSPHVSRPPPDLQTMGEPKTHQNSCPQQFLWPQTKQEIPAASAIPTAVSSWQICYIRIVCHHLCNILLSFDSPDPNQTLTTLRHRFANCLRSLGFSLGSNDVSLSFLLRLFHNEPRPFGFLLSNLLVLDCSCELFAESHVGDGDVFEGDVELLGTFEQFGADAL